MAAALEKKIELLDARLLALHARARAPDLPAGRRRWLWVQRWMLMLYREYVRDEVKMRAESLAFLTVFSLLPLIAGGFFVFTIFAQFGMVQEALGSAVNQVLDTIPAQHREFVLEYVLRFKDTYLASINGKSGSLGIFALAFLFWVGLSTLNNVEYTINRVWSSEIGRPFLERARNFVVVVVCAPLATIASLSIPLILRKLDATARLLDAFPFLGRLLDTVFPLGFVLATFTALYRYLPVQRVRWKYAAAGGAFASVGFLIVNAAMHLYFRFGTNSAYGKAAVVPLIGFWVFLAWIIIILGVEVSYIAQNRRSLLEPRQVNPSLFEGEALVALVFHLREAHRTGTNPVTFSALLESTGLVPDGLRAALKFLAQRGWVLQAQRASADDDEEPSFVIARDLSRESLRGLLEDYLVRQRRRAPVNPAAQSYDESLGHWLDFFKVRAFGDFDAPARGDGPVA
jgi:YihY family inner membrane protein